MSEHANKFCVLIVGHLLGELPSCVLEALFLSGRIAFPSLLRQTTLTPRQLKHSLSVLIQENLVLWYTSPEDGSTTYEANANGCYLWIRSSKYLANVEDRLGEPALEIMSEMIAHGHSSVGALTQAHKSLDESPISRKPLRNGFKNHDAHSMSAKDSRSVDSVQGALCDLLSAGLLQIVHESHCRPANSNRIEAEKRAPGYRDGLEIKMKKEELSTYNIDVANRLHDWKHGTEAQREELSDLRGSKKRKIDTLSECAMKKPLLSNEESYITKDDNLREDLILRINHDKFCVIERNKHLVKLAEASVGPLTSQLYAIALGILETKQLECKKQMMHSDDAEACEGEPSARELPQFSTNELRMEIPCSTDANLKQVCFPESTSLADNLGYVDDAEINMAQYDHPKKRRRRTARYDTDDSDDNVAVAGFASPDEDDSTDDANDGNISNLDSDPEDHIASEDYNPTNRNPRKRHRSQSSALTKASLSPLTKHLLLLAHHPHRFLHHLPAALAADEHWSIDVHALSKHLLAHTIFETIAAKYGPLAARLVRVLHEKGKLDTMTLQTLSLTNQKTMRATLSLMNREGFLELQEIPKDNSRAAPKNLYLWFFDMERCRKTILDTTYKTMCRVLQRIGVEKAKVKETVEKSERADVQGHEDEFLGEGEKEALAGWRAKEEKLLGELGRLDDLVAVLRDF